MTSSTLTPRNIEMVLFGGALGFVLYKIFETEKVCPTCPVCAQPMAASGAPAPPLGGGGGGGGVIDTTGTTVVESVLDDGSASPTQDSGFSGAIPDATSTTTTTPGVTYTGQSTPSIPLSAYGSPNSDSGLKTYVPDHAAPIPQQPIQLQQAQWAAPPSTQPPGTVPQVPNVTTAALSTPPAPTAPQQSARILSTSRTSSFLKKV